MTAQIRAPGSIGAVASVDPVEFQRVAFTDLSGHRAVTIRIDGSVEYADPATIGNQPVWVTAQAASAGDLVNVVALGRLEEGSWTWSPGNVYLAASGFLTQTEPTGGALVIVGVATSPTTLFVDRQSTIDL